MPFIARAALALGLARAEDGDATTWQANVTPPSRGEGGPVSAREALTLESVFRAVLTLQTAASQLSVDVWRRQEPLAVTPSLIAAPDPNDDQSGFIADTTVSLAFRGNAYWKHTRAGADGPIIGLEVLDPLTVHVALVDGRRVYHHNGRELRPGQVSHLRLLRVPGEPYGLGPIQAAARRLRGSLDVAAYGDQWFRRSGVPSGILTTEQQLNGTQATMWKQQWDERVRVGETAVLGSGLSYKSIYLTPKEAQWLDSQRWSVTTVARMFGIPPRLLMASVEGGSDTYSNAETEDRQFVKYSLNSYLRPIEQALTRVLPRGQRARFNLDGFLRAETKQRYQAHKIGLDAGFLDVEEVRRIEGLPPNRSAAPQPAPAPTEEEAPA